MPNFRTLNSLSVAAVLASGVALSSAAMAQQTPTVEQLYEMLQKQQQALQQQQKRIGTLEAGQSRAKAEAKAAKSKLAKTEAELESTRQEIAEAKYEVGQIDEQLEATSAQTGDPGSIYGVTTSKSIHSNYHSPLTVSASIGSSNLQLPETEFTAIFDSFGGPVVKFEDFDGHFENAARYDGAVEGIPTGLNGITFGVRGFYADYDNTSTLNCNSTNQRKCTHVVVVESEPFAPNDFNPGGQESQSRVDSDVENWGVSLESQFASPISPLIFKTGLAYKTIDKDMTINWDGFLTFSPPALLIDDTVYKEDLETDYWGAFVGLEAAREFAFGINLSLGGEIGIYHADTDYDGSIATTFVLNNIPPVITPTSGEVSRSRDELAFIASIQGEAGVNFGLFNVAAFAHGEWYSYAPDMVYQDGAFLSVGQVSIVRGANVDETEIKHGQAWTITGGAKVTVPLSMPGHSPVAALK